MVNIRANTLGHTLLRLLLPRLIGHPSGNEDALRGNTQTLVGQDETNHARNNTRLTGLHLGGDVDSHTRRHSVP